jgi:hypothetical protein
MMKYELGLEEPNPRQAPKSAITIAGAYAVGGLISLSAYFLTATPHAGLLWSGIITLGCLLVFGFYKSRLTGHAPVASALTNGYYRSRRRRRGLLRGAASARRLASHNPWFRCALPIGRGYLVFI